MSGEEYWTDFRGNSWIRRDAFDDLCTKYLGLRDGYVAYRYSFDAVVAKRDELSAKVAELHVQNEDLTEELGCLRSELDNLRANFDILNVKLNAFREENSALGDEVNELRIERNRWEAAYYGEVGNRSETKAALEVERRKFAQLNSEYEGLRVSYEELVHHVDQALAVEPDPAGYENESRAGKLERFARVLKARGDVNVERWNEIHRLRTERDALRTENEDLRAKYQIADGEIGDLRAKRDALRTENSELRAQLGISHPALSACNDVLRSENEELKRKFNELRKCWAWMHDFTKELQ